MSNHISIEVKKQCCEMKSRGVSSTEIYNNYFKKLYENPMAYRSFARQICRWSKNNYPDQLTLNSGTYEGFTANGATVQVSSTGDIVQAWIKQHYSGLSSEEFLVAISEKVEPYPVKPIYHDGALDMLEIPLFDMHWGISFMDQYEILLDDLIDVIKSKLWKRICIPFGQDFFHNDSIANGETTKGTPIEKVDMIRAVKEGKQFMCTLIDVAIENANEVKVIYTPGNHDQSISWMFTQTLLERYGEDIVDDAVAFRKVITFGKNAVMVTHGDEKRATPKNLAQIFSVSFPKEFAGADIREVHSGHLHSESEADIFGVMVRRLSSAVKTDKWSDRESFIGSNKRFMLFEWSPNKLRAIYYV